MKFTTRTGRVSYKLPYGDPILCASELCGNIFQRDTKNKNKIYCSLACIKKGKAPSNKIDKENFKRTCLKCPVVFYVNYTKESKKYCSVKCFVQSKIGKKGPTSGNVLSEEHKQKISNSHKKRMTPEIREKMRIAGLKVVEDGRHNNYKGGITNANTKIRNSLAYKLWRESVFKKDDYTCQICYKRGGNLQADHIKSFANYPELRLEVTNGRVLCISCHKQTPNYGFKVLHDTTL